MELQQKDEEINKLEIELYYSLSKLRNSITKFQPMNKISFCEYEVLKTIYDNNKLITTSKIGELIHVSKSSISRLINILEEKEYVRRIIRSDDRRLVHVELTIKGEKIALKEMAYFKRVYDRIIYKIGYEEIKEFLINSSNLCDVLIEEMNNDNLEEGAVKK